VQGIGQRLLDAFRRLQLVALGAFFSSSSRWLVASMPTSLVSSRVSSSSSSSSSTLPREKDGLELAAPLGARLGQAP
jgi:hypothetical protein